MPQCAIAFSGRGRLARAVALYLQHRNVPLIGLINRKHAHTTALTDLGIPVYSVSPTTWIEVCQAQEVAFIVLAGFLSLVPEEVVRKYPRRIVNSHPTLLPAFGGKGMYGVHAHRAVLSSGAQESGFTIHEVNERYDEGTILYQLRLPITGVTAEQLEAFIQAVEREVYPPIVWRLWQERVIQATASL
ncbi:MAG: phosphoribosylglycinamide formyltransferase [Bacteroidia bacterium]|nr:phosphoribosylglycinamide formyltransferase [Bacteroidia bacterium]MDW8235509.1 formyltransferase family protein [Bacteroidia bacterium]